MHLGQRHDRPKGCGNAGAAGGGRAQRLERDVDGRGADRPAVSGRRALPDGQLFPRHPRNHEERPARQKSGQDAEGVPGGLRLLP